tara:strand:- start:442 stop:912 length:471 start_codon:yes stop_codon:yes gene_type:complete
LKTPCVFLDIDGVLNSTAWWARRNTMEFPYREFDPQCLARLEGLLCSTEAALVISSSWRIGQDLLALQTMFAEVSNYWGEGTQLPERIVGATRILETERGAEVADWCVSESVESYVILDDQTDFQPEQPLVWIDPTHGLQDKDVEAALRVLGGMLC